MASEAFYRDKHELLEYKKLRKLFTLGCQISVPSLLFLVLTVVCKAYFSKYFNYRIFKAQKFFDFIRLTYSRDKTFQTFFVY